MKLTRYNLIRTRDGAQTGKLISFFVGDSEIDENMLTDVELYLRCWLESYNNSLTDDELNELFDGFDGNFRYDVYTFTLEEED